MANSKIEAGLISKFLCHPLAQLKVRGPTTGNLHLTTVSTRAHCGEHALRITPTRFALFQSLGDAS